MMALGVRFDRRQSVSIYHGASLLAHPVSHRSFLVHHAVERPGPGVAPARRAAGACAFSWPRVRERDRTRRLTRPPERHG